MKSINPKSRYTHKNFGGIWKIFTDGSWYFIEEPRDASWKYVRGYWLNSPYNQKRNITPDDYPWFIELK